MLEALRLTRDELVGKDRSVCQEIAALAAQAGFEAILAPSAAVTGETTLAVFGPLQGKVTSVSDLGMRTQET